MSSESNSNIEQLLNTRLDEDENFVSNLNYIQSLQKGGVFTEKKAKLALENRELELNNTYLENFERINDQLQSFIGKIHQMNIICNDLTNRIQSNKVKTRDLLKKTSVLQNEKKHLTAKQEYLEGFFAKYYLTDEENRLLTASKEETGTVSDGFFKAFKRLVDINQNVTEQLKVDADNLSLLEISGYLKGKLDIAFNTLHHSVLRECRLLNIEYLEVKPILYQSLECLQERPDLLESAMKEYSFARKSNVVRAFIDVLTKGGKGSVQKPIESFSNEPIRYISEMLAWIQGCIAMEKDLIVSLLKNCCSENAGSLIKMVLSNISEALCQPLKVRIEQIISREGDCVVLYRFSFMFLYYAKNYELEFNVASVLVKVLKDLHELTLNMFFSVVSSRMQRILGNMNVPDYDLLPVNAVHQALLLLRDIFETENDSVFNSFADKKSMHAKIFAHILDPLNQSIQLVCSNLHNHLDVAVYMLNCLNTIRSVIILYQFTENKLEMIKAQIDANEDVLVSEQASQVLMNCDLMDIYTKCLAHQPNQGPLAKIIGMEPERVEKAIALFNEFLQQQDGYQSSQTLKISSARIRESVQVRTLENVINAYAVMYSKLAAPENGYLDQLKAVSLKPVEEVKSLLLK